MRAGVLHHGQTQMSRPSAPNGRQLWSVRHMVVERHCLDSELYAQFAHGERFDSARIGQIDGSLQHPFASQPRTGPGRVVIGILRSCSGGDVAAS